MGFLPQTTCRRCHRQYSSLRSRCPYCGTRKPREIRRPVPEADSAVKGTAANARAAEEINWQLLFGGIILVAIVAAVIAIVSSHVGKDVAANTVPESVATANVAPTAVPTATAVPTPVPTEAPPITSLAIQFQSNDEAGFTEPAGTEVQLTALFYPLNADVTVKWSSSNDSVATVNQNGLVTCVGSGNCNIYAEAGSLKDTCQVIVK
jgi:Bacterial Ig-like domain (group 2).